MSKCDFSRASGANQDEVFPGADPFQGDEVIEGGLGHRRQRELEVVQRLAYRKGRQLETVALVGGITRRNLGLHQRAQNSSGGQRWVLAVTQSSAAIARMRASLSRRRPTIRSGVRAGT